MKVALWYGSGFLGDEYYMTVVDTEYKLIYKLIQNDVFNAHKEAQQWLLAKHPDIPLSVLDDLEFKWDGTL